MVTNAKQTQSLFTLSNDNALIETVKMSEEGSNIVLRIYEINGRYAKTQLKVNFAYTNVYETDMLENVLEELSCENGLLNLESALTRARDAILQEMLDMANAALDAKYAALAPQKRDIQASPNISPPVARIRSVPAFSAKPNFTRISAMKLSFDERG